MIVPVMLSDQGNYGYAYIIQDGTTGVSDLHGTNLTQGLPFTFVSDSMAHPHVPPRNSWPVAPMEFGVASSPINQRRLGFPSVKSLPERNDPPNAPSTIRSSPTEWAFPSANVPQVTDATAGAKRVGSSMSVAKPTPSSKDWTALVSVIGLAEELLVNICSEHALRAILGKRGLKKHLIDFEVHVSRGMGTLILQLSSQEAAEICVAHFGGQPWGPNGASVVAKCNRRHNECQPQRPRKKRGCASTYLFRQEQEEVPVRAPWSPMAEMAFSSGRKNPQSCFAGGCRSYVPKSSSMSSVCDLTLSPIADEGKSVDADTISVEDVVENERDVYDCGYVTDDGF